jgi:hemoglobin-like flavoprotein
MTLNPDILRSSFELVIDRRPDLTVRFYEILFVQSPELAPMFRRDRTAQAKMLAGAIAAVLDHLEDAPWLTTTLGELGAKHVGYGVTTAMYDQVGAALLATLAEVAAEAWTPEVAAQWTMAYGAIAGMMQAGARSYIALGETQRSGEIKIAAISAS